MRNRSLQLAAAVALGLASTVAVANPPSVSGSAMGTDQAGSDTTAANPSSSAAPRSIGVMGVLPGDTGLVLGPVNRIIRY